jgi:iron complex transport system ATP-binding protein
MFEVKDLFAGYGSGDVIRNISFRAQGGESLCVLGPNGCGKSTLLKSIARVIDCRGAVVMDGEDISAMARRELAKKVALLNQSASVYFPYTVYETVSMGRYAWSRGLPRYGLKDLSAADEEIIENILIKLDIGDIRDRMIDELSGGTLQRVFLARTLAQTPDLILLDEPANLLDLKHQIELLNFLKAWVKDSNKTLISVFHDLNLARQFSDTAIVLNNGAIAANGNIDEVLNGEILSGVYGIDIRAFMRESLGKWK